MPIAHHPVASPRGGSVWITRGEPGATATAARLAKLGFDPIIAPLLSFMDLDADLKIGPDEALAFTSVKGVERAAALTTQRHSPVFAVGDVTAEAARAAGFKSVASAGGDVLALAALIIDARPKGGVLHTAARQTAGDLVGVLTQAGVKARKLAAYETAALATLPDRVATVLASSRLCALLIHSPKAGQAAAACFEGCGFALDGVAVFGLSLACVAPLGRVGLKRLAAPSIPTEDALMAMLAAEGSLT